MSRVRKLIDLGPGAMGRIQWDEDAKKVWLRLVTFETESRGEKAVSTVIFQGQANLTALRDALIESFPLPIEQLQTLVAQRAAQELAP